jgi:hypothetical protein
VERMLGCRLYAALLGEAPHAVTCSASSYTAPHYTLHRAHASSVLRLHWAGC